MSQASKKTVTQKIGLSKKAKEGSDALMSKGRRSAKEAIPASDKILALLRGAGKPLSAYAILDKMRRQGMRSPPTVYRALEKLIRAGRVHKIESLNAFVACVHGDQTDDTEINRKKARKGPAMSRSLFVLCTHCGAVHELDDAALYQAIVKAGAPYLVRQDHCALEIAGLCSSCAASLS